MTINEKSLSSFETPFYVFDEKGFIDNYVRFENTMRYFYPKYQLSYSYKTNYTPYICKLVKKMGGFAEVVSDMEYCLAKKLGYSNEQIVFNGPVKGEKLFEHLDNNGITNIDSLSEAKLIANYAESTGKKLSVGIRINLDVGGKFISRFGLVPKSDDLERTIDVLKSSNTSIVGFHCHISRNRGIEAWKKRAEIMISTADRYIEGIPQYISLGSGMFADMDDYLKSQFDSVPSYSEYAEAALKPFFEKYGEDGPMLFTEPGTTIVARYLSFVSKVVSIKCVRGRNIATLDGSFENLGEIATLKKLPVRILKQTDGKKYDSIDLMGYTCLEQDMMYGNYSGELGEGTILLFENVGGYSIVSKPQFIRPNCPMYMIGIDGQVTEIMRAESFADVFNKFVF